jgi:hypothetical protein
MAGVVGVGDMDAPGGEPAGDSMPFANPNRSPRRIAGAS